MSDNRAFQELGLEGVKLFTPRKFGDDRGFFSETYSERLFRDVGIHDVFVQDNHSYSRSKGTVRGLHFQSPPFAQAKLVRVNRGRIFDVCVDVRQGSPTFGKWVSAILSDENWSQLYVPVGFLHGFVTLEEETEVQYKVTNFYNATADGGVIWNDPDLAIDWPITIGINLSPKDAMLPFFADFQSPFEYSV